MRNALWLGLLLTVGALSGCFGNDDNGNVNGDESQPVYDVTGPRSVTLEAGEYDILPGLDIYVDVPLPVTEGGQAVNPVEPPRVHLGLFLPNIPGCNFDTITDMVPGTVPGTLEGGAYDNENPDCQVPIIADAGPYYRTPGDALATSGLPLVGEGDVPAAERDSGRLGEWLISNFVPHGYGVAQISVFGSGLSNHCFDMFGLAEQLGVHHAVEYLGKADYSNGNVGLIGRSYDGSTPWMAAKHGSEHLKTIVPISGLSGLGDLVQWNGASETRILTFQNVIYGRFGFDSNQLATDAATHATCPDWVTATPMGAASYASGDEVTDAEATYWEERKFIPGALANYEGSLFMIHGLQDSNVDPHAGWIAELALRDNGNDVKALWGQWYHSYPDRISEHGFQGHPDSIRMDWAQIMLEWFDHYLMETGPKPELDTQIQQIEGPWRSESVWPPLDANILDLGLGDGTVTVGTGGETHDINLGPIGAGNDLLLGGFSHVTIQATAMEGTGAVSVEIIDGTTGEDFGISWGVMDVRYANEGNPVPPGGSVTMDIPLQLFDGTLPAGHDLVLRIGSSVGGYGALAPGQIEVDLASSTLHLSTLDRDDSYTITPPVWYDEAEDGTLTQKVASE